LGQLFDIGLETKPSGIRQNSMNMGRSSKILTPRDFWQNQQRPTPIINQDNAKGQNFVAVPCVINSMY